MDIINSLAAAGLSKPEIVIYLYLLERGLSTPAQIAKGTQIQRANTYNVLGSLIEKGLIDKQPKGKRYLYTANDPESLITNHDKKKNAISDILPDLRGLYKTQRNKPTIKFLYGIDDIKETFLRSDGAREILFIASTGTLFQNYPDEFKAFRKKLAKEQVFIRDILTQTASIDISTKTNEVMGAYYEYRLFEQKYEDLPTTIRIWNDNIALISFEEPAFGTIITNPALAQTFRVMFETMWKAGKSG